jgi:hypothetical protein
LAEGVFQLLLSLAVARPVPTTKRFLPLLPSIPRALGERREGGGAGGLRSTRLAAAAGRALLAEAAAEDPLE